MILSEPVLRTSRGLRLHRCLNVSLRRAHALERTFILSLQTSFDVSHTAGIVQRLFKASAMFWARSYFTETISETNLAGPANSICCVVTALGREESAANAFCVPAQTTQ